MDCFANQTIRLFETMCSGQVSTALGICNKAGFFRLRIKTGSGLMIKRRA